MRRWVGTVTAVLAMATLPGPLWSHHSSTAYFDLDQKFDMSGTLSGLDWRNPHIQFSLEVRGDDGQVEAWLIEGWSPGFFASHKISKALFERTLGQTVAVEVSPARDRSHYATLWKVTFPDGTSVVNREA